jgi:multidrug resistance efflux pump
MLIKQLFRVLATLLICAAAIAVGRTLWLHYMDRPWTRDGRVRAYVINVAPDVSGAVVALPVRDNQWVHRGDLLLEIDPARFKIAVAQAEAAVEAKKINWDMRRQDAKRRADLNSMVVSVEQRENASLDAAAAYADYQAALAQLAGAQLNLERTRVVSPVDGYITNLQLQTGDYVTAGSARLALIDSHSFWVYGYFEETKLPRLHLGDVARIELMSGEHLRGHIESITRGIYDRDNPQSRDLTADVNPTFNWVRLAQRVPVRIQLDEIPPGLMLAAGQTCTVVIEETHKNRTPDSLANKPTNQSPGVSSITSPNAWPSARPNQPPAASAP